MNLKIAGKNQTRWNMLFLFLAAAAVCLLLPVPSSFCADDDMISLPSKKTTDKAATVEKTKPAETAPASISLLQGVFYDFKLLKNGSQNNDFRNYTNSEAGIPLVVNVLRPFVNGKWRREYDGQGRVHFSDLDKYYCSPTRVWSSFFYMPKITTEEAPKAFYCGSEVKPGAWCCIFSGYVKAPFTGKFRFVGYGDDYLVIRFNQQVVFDYGWISATLGERFDDGLRKRLSDAPSKQIVRSMPKIDAPESSFYSDYKPEFFLQSLCDGQGIATGKTLSVKAGDVIPIDILIGDIGGTFKYALFIEPLNANGEPMVKNPSKLQLFRTTTDLPELTENGDIPAFNPTGPIWKVVDRFGRPITVPKNSTAQSAAKDKTAASTAATGDKATAEKTTTGTATSTTTKEKQQTSADGQTTVQNNKKVVKTETKGNATIRTTTEKRDDVTIETKVTTEKKGNQTIETTVITETKGGKVVKKTETTTTTTTTETVSGSAETSTPKQTSATANTEKKTAAEEKKQTTTQTSGRKVSPFGVSQRPVEDDD